MTRSVLVVDDDPAFRSLARRLLTAAGLKVVGEADSAEAGLEVARELQPEAALVDVDLPGQDGVWLARELTQLSWRPRVVLTSVDEEAAPPGTVRRCGAVAFLHKADLANGSLERLLGDE